MKRLSDYKGDEAIELWGDLLEPIIDIFSDKKIADVWKTKKSIASKAKEVLKLHKKEVTSILLRIDDTPLNGINIVIRLVNLLVEIESAEELKDFFGFAEQGTTANASIGSVTENIEDDEN